MLTRLAGCNTAPAWLASFCVSRYLCKLRSCAAESKAPGGSNEMAQLRGCFSSPESDAPAKRRALLDAARVAGFADPKVCIQHASSSAATLGVPLWYWPPLPQYYALYTSI